MALALAPAALAEQKNIQVLYGLSDFELQRNMQMIAASLGVRCDFCHAESATDKGHLDFPLDVKKEKETARDMMQMVMKINREGFAGRIEVSCNTCHRGSTRPVSLVTLPQTPPQRPAAPATATAAPKPTLPTLEEIVKNYTTALGDVSKLQGARTFKGTREGSDGKPLPMQVDESGTKVHTLVTLGEGSAVEQWYDNTNGASRDGRGVHKFSDANAEAFRQLTSAYDLVLPSAIPKEGRVFKDKIGDREVYVVTSRLDETTRQRLYFDTTTGLLVRRLIVRDFPIGPIPQQTDFDDYRDAGGVKYPYMVRVSVVDPFTGSIRRYTDVKLGAKLEDSVFTPPAETPPSASPGTGRSSL